MILKSQLGIIFGIHLTTTCSKYVGMHLSRKSSKSSIFIIEQQYPRSIYLVATIC